MITIENNFDIEYLTYREFKLKEKEYEKIAKLRALEQLKISDIEKLLIELFLNNYNREINRIKRKLEFGIIKETLY